MALDVVYRSLDRVARGHPSDWVIILIEQATGYYSVMFLLPAVFWVARRWSFHLSVPRIGVHVAAIVCFSFVAYVPALEFAKPSLPAARSWPL